MQNILRAFVLVLAFTGAVASSKTIATVTPSVEASAVSTADFPIPTCPPDDPNACGIGR